MSRQFRITERGITSGEIKRRIFQIGSVCKYLDEPACIGNVDCDYCHGNLQFTVYSGHRRDYVFCIILGLPPCISQYRWTYAHLGYWHAGLSLTLILIVAFSINEISMFLVFLLFPANISLDIAEGYAARKYGRASEFGTAFDQEIDTYFALVAGMYF